MSGDRRFRSKGVGPKKPREKCRVGSSSGTNSGTGKAHSRLDDEEERHEVDRENETIEPSR
jgi:hypothetical protein